MPPADSGYSLTSREPKTETIPPEISLGGQRQEGNGRSPSPEVLSDQRPPCPCPARSGLFLPPFLLVDQAPTFCSTLTWGLENGVGRGRRKEYQKVNSKNKTKQQKQPPPQQKTKTEIKIKNQEIQMGKRKRQKEKKNLKWRKEKEN